MPQAPLVLIVDDVRDNREAYAEYLQHHGFRVIEAGTGAETLAQVRRSHPDVILLDLRLPDVTGEEVTRRLRAAGHTRMKIIALSACVFQQDIDAALESGVDSFLSKPCLPDAVISEIRRVLAAPPGDTRTNRRES